MPAATAVINPAYQAGSSNSTATQGVAGLTAGLRAIKTVSGKVSWFGGPNDSMSGPTTSSGRPVSEPAISLYDQSTKGGYWLATMPNGTRAILRQNDIGPAPWTGRKFDVTYTALQGLGYTEGNFPTDANMTAQYLGQYNQLPANVRTALGSKTMLVLSGPNAGATGGSLPASADLNPLDPLGVLPSNPLAIPGEVFGAFETLVNTYVAFVKLVTDIKFWIRVGEAIMGAYLLYAGMKTITGSDPAGPVVNIAKKTAKTAAKTGAEVALAPK